jgi:hypothetical protein
MKTIIYPSLLFIGICLSSLFGCKKENSVSPKFDDYFILEHYTGTRDTFRYEAPYSKALGFNSYKSSVGNYYSGRYVKVFSLFKGVLSDNYELVLAKPDDAITIGQTYRNNTSSQVLTSFTQTIIAPNNIVTTATITDIQFSEYKPGERITGNFKAYANGLLWFKGEFSFKPSN